MRRFKLFGLLCFSLISSVICQENWWDNFTNTVTPPTNIINKDDLLYDYYDINDEGICCECVQFYLCDDNNTIIDSGVGLDPRIGNRNTPPLPKERDVEQCTDITKHCCRVPSAPENCLNAPRKIDLTGSAVEDCECYPWELCSPESMISDGSPSVTTLENGVQLPNHARCPHSLEVCCYFEPDNTDNTTINPEGQCACVNPWMCENGYVITDGILPSELNELYSNMVNSCTAPFTCCKIRDMNPTSPTLPPTILPPVVIESKQCYGVRNADGIRVRISGFKEGESQFGEFPWVAMVLSTFFVAGQPMNNFLGGAILIHPSVVLTAAHKVHKESISTLTVRVGEWDALTEHEPGKHQIREIDSIIIHPEFKEKSLYHDVALLILREPVVLQPHIRSICMANNLDEVDTTRCVINGWGEDSFGSDNYQTVMKSVELPIVPHRRCQAMLRRTRLGRWFRLHSSFICAGGIEGRDACRSDGGGPLACPRKGSPDEYLLVGITAWGIGCGENGVPGVYASTIEDKSWITENMAAIFPNIHSLLKRDLNSGNEILFNFNPWRSDLDTNSIFTRNNVTSNYEPTNVPTASNIQTTTPKITTTTTTMAAEDISTTAVGISNNSREKRRRERLQTRIERERRNRASRRRERERRNRANSLIHYTHWSNREGSFLK